MPCRSWQHASASASQSDAVACLEFQHFGGVLTQRLERCSLSRISTCSEAENARTAKPARAARRSPTSAQGHHTEQIAAHMPWPGAFPSTWQAHAAHGVFGQLERFAMWACAQCCRGLAVHDMPTHLSPATRLRCQCGSSDAPPAPRAMPDCQVQLAKFAFDLGVVAVAGGVGEE